MSQSVSCPSVITATTVNYPCGGNPACTTLTARVPDIRQTVNAANGYLCNSIPYSGNYGFPMTGGTQVLVNTDDQYSDTIHLPFNFCFYGSTFTKCVIGANGNISFAASNYPTVTVVGPVTTRTYAVDDFDVDACALPCANAGGSNSHKNTIFAGYHDINPAVGGTIKYKLIGTAPCRKLIVNWDNIPEFNTNSNISHIQCVLFENTNVIETYIKKAISDPAWQSGVVIVGVQNAAGTFATTAPGRNMVAVTLTEEAWQFLPNGSSLLNNIALFDSASRTQLQAGTVGTTGAGLIDVSFPNVCINPANAPYHYYIRAKYNSCSGSNFADSTFITLTGTNAVAPTVNSPVTYCQGAAASPLTAMGSNPAGFQWYDGPGATATLLTVGATGPTPSTATAGTTTYYVSQVSGSCQSSRVPISVVTNPKPPPPTVVSPVSYCKGATATALTATPSSGSTIYRWYDSLSDPGHANAPTPNTSATGSRTYSVTQISAGGCISNKANITVNVAQAPAPTVATPVLYCQGDTATQLTAGGPGPFTWYNYPDSNGTGPGYSPGPTPNTSAVGTTYYYVSQTINNCKSPVVKITVQVSNGPLPPAPVDAHYCQFDAASPVYAGGSSVKWYASSNPADTTSIAVGNNGPTPSTANAGTITYYASRSSSNCGESARVPLYVTIYPKPAAPAATPPAPYCQNAPASPLTATRSDMSDSLSWYYPSNTMLSGAPTPSTATVGTFTYYVLEQSPYGCMSDARPVPVTVRQTPTAPVVTNPRYCQGDPGQPLTATPTGTGTLKWYPSPAPDNTGSSTTAPTANTSSGSYFYYVSQVDSSCESNRSVLSVTVNPKPAPPIVLDAVYCKNDPASPIAVTYNPDTAYWYNGANQYIGHTPPTPNTAVVGMQAFYVNQKNVYGCTSGRDTATVTVNPVPQAPLVSGPVPYCEDAPAVPLTATPSGTNDALKWYFPSTNLLQGAPTPATDSPGSFTYYVAETNQFGCKSPQSSITVNVTATPAPPVASNPAQYCQGSTASPLSATASSGNTLTWYPHANDTMGKSSTPPTPNTSVAGSFVYYVTQKNSGGCESGRTMIRIAINPKPATPVVSPIRYCQYDPASRLNLNIQNPTWYDGPGAGANVISEPTPNTNVPGTYHYWVSSTQNSCESERADVEVRVLGAPKGSVMGTKTEICQYALDTLWFAGSAPAGTVITWILPSGVTQVQQIGSDTIVVSADSTGSHRIRMSAENQGCRSDTSSFTINVNPAQRVSITADREVCLDVPSRVELTSTTVVASDFHWDFGGGQPTLGREGGPYLIKWPAAGIYIVSVSGTADRCPTPKAYDTITVHESPDAHIAYIKDLDGRDPICTGDSLQLTAVTAQTAISHNIYTWTPAFFFNGGKGADSTLDRATAYVRASGYIGLQITNQYGCKDKDSVLVRAEPCCDVMLPSAFSPNADGRNDVFRILTVGHHRIAKFMVTNRWGQTVFETADESKGWDGSFNGVPQEAGSYFYYLRYQCEATNKFYESRGDITLIR